MKRIFSLLMVLVLSAGLIFVPAYAADNDSVALKTRNDFYWGMNHHEGQYMSYQWEYMEEQIHLSAKAGCTMIRTGGTIDGDLTYQDQFVGLCNKYGIKVIMVFKPSEEMGLEYITLACKTLAERYNGKDGRGFVDYIQVWNEIDALMIKAKHGTGGPAGSTYDAYYTTNVDNAADLPEYTENYRAAAKGIHEADSDTQFMINFCYKGWGSILWYLENGVEIDAIGWDSYGQSADHEVAAQKFKEDCDALYESVVKKYNIPVIICEANTSQEYIKSGDSTKKLETHETLLKMMDIAYTYDWIKGFTIYELMDQPYRGDGENTWGMVECDTNGIIGEAKPIYWELQKRLGGNENLEMLDRSIVDLTPYEKLKVDTTDDSHIGENKNDTSVSGGNANIESDSDSDLEINNIDSNGIPDVLEKKPDTIITETNIVEKSFKMPWLILILSAVGIFLLIGGGVALFVIIDKKRTKNKN